MTLGHLWNIPVTTADTRVGDHADGSSDNTPLVWGYPPFLGRRTYRRSGIARGTRGSRAGVPESERTNLNIPEKTKIFTKKILPARKNLPARKRFPARKRLPALWQ